MSLILMYSKQVLLALWLASFSFAYAHSGRTNSDGCHNERATGGYHCHSGRAATPGYSSSRPSLGQVPVRNEDYYNRLLARALNGKAETSHDYIYEGGRATIRVDIETSKHVIEGGLDKRSSLDSLQQAVFAAIVTGKKPVVVIYDTDGKEGRFEHRIKSASKRANVEFLNLNETEIKNLTGFK